MSGERCCLVYVVNTYDLVVAVTDVVTWRVYRDAVYEDDGDGHATSQESGLCQEVQHNTHTLHRE